MCEELLGIFYTINHRWVCQLSFMIDKRKTRFTKLSKELSSGRGSAWKYA